MFPKANSLRSAPTDQAVSFMAIDIHYSAIHHSADAQIVGNLAS
jgi:hypothetical protein